MSRALRGALLACALLALGAAPANAAFGLNGFDVAFKTKEGFLQAGAHPESITTSFNINHTGVGNDAQPDGEIKDAVFEQVEGLVINPEATPTCSNADFLTSGGIPDCASETKVGEVGATVLSPDAISEVADVFNLDPPPGSAARLGFRVLGVPLVVDGAVSPEPPFTLLGTLRNTRQSLKVFASTLTLEGLPAGADEPFLTLPGSCTGPAPSFYEATSWEGDFDSGLALSHEPGEGPQGFTGCEQLPFEPEIASQATAASAESASGLRFTIDFDQAGLLDPDGRAQSTIKAARVALPEGLTANPSIAEGLGVCSEADLDRETLASDPGEGCPNASKIGTISVQTPLLEQDLQGSVFIAASDDPATAASENPFDSLIAFYMVIKQPRLGVLLKLPAKVTPDPETGQLITTVEDLPQIPFSRFEFRFREGQRAPLITPPRCGSYSTEARFTPWARPGEPQTLDASFRIDSGPGGGPCPSGAPPFEPGFSAGTLNNAAATYSPFLMRITRNDGDQDLTRFDAALPPGVTGRLAGVDQCPAAQIALAKAKTGRAEQASPSCPLSSKIGSTLAGAGVGGQLTYVPGSLYLSGPYNGAPLSVVAVTPALAGPFDAGTVVVRVALRVDPRTAEVSVDGAASDPIPHILQGIPLKVRELRVSADRPGFTLNPTSCQPYATGATLWGGGRDAFSAADDLPVFRAARFQAADCGALGFEPKLGLKLRGATKRGGFPALRAHYRPRPGDANLSRLALAFPTSAFVEQGHFRTICTRVQFAAGAGHGSACPPGATYGRARVWTPLLDEPLQGPVILRSSDHNLPDAVFALRGLVDLEVAVRIDSVRGRLRATVQGAPDAPVSRAIVDMQGAQKGLFVNSRDLCLKPARNRAGANLRGQNGRLSRTKPRVIAVECQKRRKAKRRRAKRAAKRSLARVSRASARR